MAFIKTRDGTEIYYKDWGAGQPVVFSHGWPLTADAWDAQMVFLGEAIASSPMTGAAMAAPASPGPATTWTLVPTILRN
jgi:pimeloyl-ACP methyl ester carboxylesterase